MESNLENNIEMPIVVDGEPVMGEVLASPNPYSAILKSLSVKEKSWKSDRDKKKKKNKGRFKSKSDLQLAQYDEHLDNFNVLDLNRFDPFMREQSRLREGNVIPEELKLGLYDESGFFFGMKHEHNIYIGKPAHKDGHILIAGTPGSGKTQAIVIPSMMTWSGIQIIIDVKGNLSRHWYGLNKHRGKQLKVFSPGAPKYASCGYDPYALFRHDGPNKVVGNARDLALALMPLLPTVKDPVWVKATQNFLTGAFIHYFTLGATFAETMIAIQKKPLSELLQEIVDDDNFAAMVYVSKLKDVQDKVLANIGMELNDLANLVIDPALLTSYDADEQCGLLDWVELSMATEPFDVILEFPEENLERWQPLLMLMINQLIKVLERRPERTYKQGKELPPILVMLDEFPRLGKVSAIINGLATLRSRGVTFALFVQSWAQLEETYGSITARVIAEICAYKIVLDASDAASQECFSKMTGTTESTQRSVNVNHDPTNGRPTGYGKGISEMREPIIYPHEFISQSDVVVISRHGFFRVDKVQYVDNQKMFMLPQIQASYAAARGDSVAKM